MSGKKMPYTCTEVVIKLKAPPIGLFDGHEFNDRIVMRFQPNPHLDIRVDMKSPGLDDKVQTATLTHPYPEGAIDGYVKLFYDSLNGDQSHFVHRLCWIIPFGYELSFVCWTPTSCVDKWCCSNRTFITNT